MQVFMILLNIACNMQNMQNNMHDMQNMQTSFPICRICTAHFADGVHQAHSIQSDLSVALHPEFSNRDTPPKGHNSMMV